MRTGRASLPAPPESEPHERLVEIFTGLAALTVVMTLLPLSRSEGWWVRAWDFPRLQVGALAIAQLGAAWVLLDLSRPSSWLPVGAVAACALYQAWWIFPYTRLHRTEVDSAEGIDPARRLRVLVSNVLTPNRNASGLLEVIRANDPDLVLAVETDRWWESRLDALEPEYPFALKCPLENLYGMHLYSRLPMEDPKIQFLVESDVPSMHTVLVLGSGDRVRLHCLHPAPPSPTENPASRERAAELVVVGKAGADAELPVVVMGDLNDVAWSATTRLFRKISGLLDPRVGRGMFNTYHARVPLVRWPLDHLFHSGAFRLVEMRRLPAIGSDHFPILVELQLIPEERGKRSTLRVEPEDHRRVEEKAGEEGVDEGDVPTPGE